jgi:hypothetical protein
MTPAPNLDCNIAVRGDCAYFRPVGKVTLEQATDLCDQAIAYARDRGIPKLFINAKALIGFPSPSLPERYFLARKWAATGQGRVQVALVIRAEMIDPEKFGVIVARNAGMNADVFADEPEALDWLLGPQRPKG